MKSKLQYALSALRGALYVLVNVLLVFVVIYGTVIFCKKGYTFCYEIFGSVVVEEAPGTDVDFEVDSSDTIDTVADRLYKNRIIVNRQTFYIRTRFMEPDELELKPGKYTLNTSMDYETILKQLTFGD